MASLGNQIPSSNVSNKTDRVKKNEHVFEYGDDMNDSKNRLTHSRKFVEIQSHSVIHSKPSEFTLPTDENYSL